MSSKHDENPKGNIIKIGVRDLLWSLYRTGGLRNLEYHQLSKNAGTRTHQAFFQVLEEEYLQFDVQKEYTLKYFFENDNALYPLISGMEIHGRADIILTPIADENIVSFQNIEGSPDYPFVIEVKTLIGPLEALPHEGEYLHWLQVRLYTYLFNKQLEKDAYKIPENISYALAYVSQETLETRYFIRSESFADLENWVQTTVDAYYTVAQNTQDWFRRRDDSIREMKFPYSRLRDGQADFIKQAYDSIGRISPLLAQAPTGIGKTMSVLYPSIKHLPSGQYQHIFYLTAKTSTRRVCEAAVADLRALSNLQLRQITLQAKESMCLAPELYCDTKLCPFAREYYDNLKPALSELLLFEELNASLLMEAGKKHKLCPFELSLDIALYCDLIIGDYNHAFDPRVQLERFFHEDIGQQILLLDEAHNLVDRSRDMYSVTLEEKDFQTIMEILPNNNPLILGIWNNVLDYFRTLANGIKNNELAWDVLEEAHTDSSMQVLSQDNFRATRSKLQELSNRLVPWLKLSREYLDEITEPKIKRVLIELISKAKFFNKITEEYWSKSYISVARIFKDKCSIRLICLDVSERLSQTYMNIHATVFFSATLSPMPYFSLSFCGKDYNNRPDTLILPSPFPPENLEVYISNFIKTTYRERNASANALAKALALAILLRKGQQMLFFPSFAYMDLILPLLNRMLSGQDIQFVTQSRLMSNLAREKFLSAFENPKAGKTVVGVAVLGGIFGEGIDLTGEKLTGVSIVGVGLPQISPERNIMREYYDEEYQAGYMFAYQYPGMNKVLQAAGRLIRSEEDRGFLLLLDDRYNTASYRQLLPEDWNLTEVDSLADLKTNLLENRTP